MSKEQREQLYIDIVRVSLEKRYKILIEILKHLKHDARVTVNLNRTIDEEKPAISVLCGEAFVVPEGNYQNDLRVVYMSSRSGVTEEFLNRLYTVIYHDVVNTIDICKDLDNLVNLCIENGYKIDDFISMICDSCNVSISSAIKAGFYNIREDYNEKTEEEFKTFDDFWLGTLSKDEIIERINSKSNDFCSRFNNISRAVGEYVSEEVQTVKYLDNNAVTNKIIVEYLFGKVTGYDSEKLSDESKEKIIDEYRYLVERWCSYSEEYDWFKYCGVSYLHNIDNLYEKSRKEILESIQKADEILLDIPNKLVKEQLAENDKGIKGVLKAELKAKKIKAEALAKLGQTSDLTADDLEMLKMKHFALDNSYDKYLQEMLANKELMYYVASLPNVDSSLINYVSKELQNDLGFISLLIINSNDIYKWYKPGVVDGSNLEVGESININIRSNPMFWTMLNAKIESLSARDSRVNPDKRYSLFDMNKEWVLVQQEALQQFGVSGPKKN